MKAVRICRIATASMMNLLCVGHRYTHLYNLQFVSFGSSGRQRLKSFTFTVIIVFPYLDCETRYSYQAAGWPGMH